MKETTTTRYECSDGQQFGNKETAQQHELTIWLKEHMTSEQKLTVPALLTVVLEHSDDFVSKLGDVVDVVGEG